VLSLDAVQTMRDQVLSGRRSARPEAGRAAAAAGDAPGLAGHGDEAGPQGLLIARLGIRDLLVLGIISNRGMVALAAVLGLLSQVEIMPSQEQLEGMARSIPGIETWSTVHTVALATLAVAAGIVALRLLSMLWAVIALHGFTLHRDQDELRSRYGLLTQHTATIPRHRIQIVQVESGVLHRVFGRVTVRARTAGSGTQVESGLRQDWLAPLVRTSELGELLIQAHPELDPEPLEWQTLPRRAIRRLRWRVLLMLTLPAVALTAAAWPWALAVWPLVAPAIWLVPILQHRHMAWCLGDDALWFRSGWLRRTTRVVRFAKMQAIGTIESPFDRRHRMCTLTVDAANAGTGRHAIAIRYLPRDTAARLAAHLADRASETRFRW
jgi:putative membrane protein